MKNYFLLLILLVSASPAFAQSASGFAVSDHRCKNPDKECFSLVSQWSGTVDDSIAGQGQLDLTVDPYDPATSRRFEGTWSSTFPDPVYDNGGTLTGKIDTYFVLGVTFAMKLNPSAHGASSFLVPPTRCRFRVTGILSGDGYALQGNYVALHCSEAISGSFDLKRQLP